MKSVNVLSKTNQVALTKNKRYRKPDSMSTTIVFSILVRDDEDERKYAPTSFLYSLQNHQSTPSVVVLRFAYQVLYPIMIVTMVVVTNTVIYDASWECLQNGGLRRSPRGTSGSSLSSATQYARNVDMTDVGGQKDALDRSS